MSTYLLGPRDKIIKATVMPVAMGPPSAPPPFWLQATHIVIKVKNKVPINSAKRAPKIFRDMVEKEVCLIDSNIKLEGKVNGKSREWSRILWKFRLFIRVRFIHKHVYLSFSACLLSRLIKEIWFLSSNCSAASWSSNQSVQRLRNSWSCRKWIQIDSAW